jgi:hypothetical protein
MARNFGAKNSAFEKSIIEVLFTRDNSKECYNN